MKKVSLIFLILFGAFSCSEPELSTYEVPGIQTADVVSLETPGLDGANNILLNATGYNLKFPGRAEPWQITSPRNFKQGLLDSEANMIRYPGGGCSNYWNFHTDKLLSRYHSYDPDGWVNADRVSVQFVSDLIANDEQQVNSVADLQQAAADSGSRVVFVMNMVTPGNTYYTQEKGWNNPNPGSTNLNDDWYKMLNDRYERFKSMLLRAQSGANPITVRFIELGNELYFGGSDPNSYYYEAFPTAKEYGIAAKYIANKLVNDTDLNLVQNVRIAAVGCHVVSSSDSRIQDWNTKLKNELDKPDGDPIGYVTLHTYEAFEEPASYTETNFQTKLVEWYQRVNSKYNSVSQGGSNADIFVNSNRGIWYTELSANWEGGLSGIKDIEFTWGQNLADAYSAMHLFDRGKADMYLQYKFDGIVKTNTETGTGKQVYNRALALLPLMKAAKGANRGARINFAQTNVPKLPNSPKAVVQGYCFLNSSDVAKCAFVNLSASNRRLNLNNIFTSGSSTLTLESWNHTLSDLGGTAEPTYSVNTYNKSDITLKPFSVTYVYQAN